MTKFRFSGSLYCPADRFNWWNNIRGSLIKFLAGNAAVIMNVDSAETIVANGQHLFARNVNHCYFHFDGLINWDRAKCDFTEFEWLPEISSHSEESPSASDSPSS